MNASAPHRVAAAAAVVGLAVALALASGCGEPGLGAGPSQAFGHRGADSGCRVRGRLPDPACTPGAVLTSAPAIVCRAGYARRARHVSWALKRRIYRAYGVNWHRPGAYEIDHLVPLELGGSNAVENLWPQPARPRPGFHEKDVLENRLHALVCGGWLDLGRAQREVAADWVAVYRRLAAASP